MMKRLKNDDISKRAKLSKKLTRTTTTSMHELVSSKQNHLSNQSNRRMAEDANTMAALASVIIRSRGEYDDAHKEVVEQIKEASAQISLSEEDSNNLVSIINPFVSIPPEEATFAQRLIAKKDQYTLVKLPNLKAQLSLKGLLEACRQSIALGQAIEALQPNFISVANLLLHLGQVISYLDTQIVHHMDPNETILLRIIIEKTLCGRRKSDVESVAAEFLKQASDGNSKDNDLAQKANELLDVFENTYRIIDVTDGKIAFVEEISFT